MIRISGTQITFKEVERYSFAEFKRSCQEKGFLSDTIAITLWDFAGKTNVEYTLINALVDIEGRGMAGIKIADYEVVGSKGQTIIINLTLTLTEQTPS